jgi:hypothetical protein
MTTRLFNFREAQVLHMTYIRWRCPCGKSLKAPPNASGKRCKCPRCGRADSVPAGDFEHVDDLLKGQASYDDSNPFATGTPAPHYEQAKPAAPRRAIPWTALFAGAAVLVCFIALADGIYLPRLSPSVSKRVQAPAAKAPEEVVHEALKAKAKVVVREAPAEEPEPEAAPAKMGKRQAPVEQPPVGQVAVFRGVGDGETPWFNVGEDWEYRWEARQSLAVVSKQGATEDWQDPQPFASRLNQLAHPNEKPAPRPKPGTWTHHDWDRRIVELGPGVGPGRSADGPRGARAVAEGGRFRIHVTGDGPWKVTIIQNTNRIP